MVSVPAPTRAWDRGTGHSALYAAMPNRSPLEVTPRGGGTHCASDDLTRAWR